MTSRNHSLDVLRALAVILVVNCHAASYLGNSGYLSAFQLGGVGVDLFFVLSGWLLGQQLLRELHTTGQIDISRFWYRRWMRTLPAYYAVLALTFFWQVTLRSNWDLCWSYLVFGQNYATNFPYFTVSWSLCVEEHFYLVVAPLLVVVFRFRPAAWLLPAILAIPTLCRYMGWYFHDTVETHVRYDECASGVVLAYCYEYKPWIWRWLCRLAPAACLGGLAAFCYNVLARLNPSWDVGDLPITARCLIFASFVLLGNSSDFWKRRMRLPLCRYLAERSYAVYLLHPEALALMKHGKTLHPVLYFALSWALTLVLAEILYRAVERPFMRAREWFPAMSANSTRAVSAPAAAESLIARPVLVPDTVTPGTRG
jgi:peptidoglycan/LPS O-acetylase OafA/YrhL